jgi:nucleoside 2-deoxyribosyltransferase
MKTVYLGGPITGRTALEAKAWRNDVGWTLAYNNIRAISPLRCEADPDAGAVYASNGNAKGIAAKNLFDVRSCDLILCYMPECFPLSVGTLAELAYAHALAKPTILVTTDEDLLASPIVQACASWSLATLSEACDVCIGLLADYAALPVYGS